MSLLDITRHIYQPAKRYDGVVRLQGAVITDADDNEDSLIASQISRHALIDPIGANGSPNDGFKVLSIIENPAGGVGKFDLLFSAGSFFLGGKRYSADDDFTLSAQTDWLQFGGVDALPSLPPIPGDKNYLTLLEGRESYVSPREDSELLDAGLDKIPTSGRTHLTRRVSIVETQQESCIDAFSDYIDNLTTSGMAFDPQTGALTHTTKLEVSFHAEDASEDLCTPRNSPGYRGDDNETVYVRIVEPGFFIWGVADASPLYRVKIEPSDSGASGKVVMITPPWDQISQPKAGDVVEFLPWGAILPNQEKLAEQTGPMARVNRSYDRSSRSFQIEDIDAQLGPIWNWANLESSDYQSAADGDSAIYIYMRVLRGDVMPSNTTRLAMDNVNGTKLGKTGLLVKFDGHYSRIQDAIDALPIEGGKICVLKGTFYGPLNLSGRTNITIEGCGRLSHVVLPDDQTVPLLAITASSHIAIRSLRLTARHEIAVMVTKANIVELDPAPDCFDVTLEKLIIEGRDASAIFASPVENLKISECQISFAALVTPITAAFDEGQLSPGVMPGIVVAGTHIRIERNRIETEAESVLYRAFGGIHVLEGCADVLIEKNLIRKIGGLGVAIGSYSVVTSSAAGGMMAAGDVLAALEMARGVSGETTSGEASFLKVKNNGAQYDKSYQVQFAHQHSVQTYWAEPFVTETDDGCGEADPAPKDPDLTDPTPETEIDTGDPILALRIIDNEISDTGMSGIGVLRYFDLSLYAAIISVVGLEILGNRISRAAQYNLPTLSGSYLLNSGYGGIALGSVEQGTISRNTITQCGSNVVNPICGIFILHGKGLVIENNQITENGGQPSLQDGVEFGRRAGVAIGLASAPQMEFPPADEIINKLFDGQIKLKGLNGIPALRLHDNIIVQPEGRAFMCDADGPISVQGNQLVSRGASEMSRAFSAISALSQGASSIYLFIAAILAGSDDLSSYLLKTMGGAVVSISSLPGNEDDLSRYMNYNEEVGDTPVQTFIDWMLYRGEVILQGNQMIFDGHNAVPDLLLSGVSIVGADDARITANQYQAHLFQGSDLQFCVGHFTVLTLDSAQVSNNYIRHPVQTPAKSPIIFQNGDGFFGPHTNVIEKSIYMHSTIASATDNHLSGGIQLFGLNGHKAQNLQLLKGLNA